MPQTCAAYGCKISRTMQTRQRGVGFHRFPTDPELKKAWETAVKRKGFVAKHCSVLCSQHFRVEDIDRTGQVVRLKEGAIPCIFDFPAPPQTQPGATRPTVKAQTKVSATRELTTEAQGSVSDRTQEALACDEHSYALIPSLDSVKNKLVQALARVQYLEQELCTYKDIVNTMRIEAQVIEQAEEEEQVEIEILRNMHVTVHKQSDGPVSLNLCEKCRLYHCPFCQPSIYKPREDFANVWTHIESHRHKALQHGGKGHFHCPYCPKTFINRRDIQRHMDKCLTAPNMALLPVSAFIENTSSCS